MKKPLSTGGKLPLGKKERELSDEIQSSLVLLSSSDPTEQTMAAKRLSALFRRSYNRVCEDWARHPEVRKALAQALNHPITHEAAAIALGACIGFYVHQKRAAALMIPVLTSPSALARRWAVESVLWVEDEAIWEKLSPLVKDPSPLVRMTVYRAVGTWIYRGLKLSVSCKKHLKQLLMDALEDRDAEVRMTAQFSLEKFAD